MSDESKTTKADTEDVKVEESAELPEEAGSDDAVEDEGKEPEDLKGDEKDAGSDDKVEDEGKEPEEKKDAGSDDKVEDEGKEPEDLKGDEKDAGSDDKVEDEGKEPEEKKDAGSDDKVEDEGKEAKRDEKEAEEVAAPKLTDADRFPKLEKAPAKSSGKAMYAALLATVGVAAFFAGLSVPVLNQDPVTMSDLNQAMLFLEDKIDKLSNDLQNLEDAMLTEPGTAPPQEQMPTITPDDDPVLGSADAPITIIEFSDFQCPFCARFYSETLPLIKANFIDTGVVKMVYRDFPIQSIHPNAVPAAVASECADEQGSYWEYHDMLFDNMETWGPLATETALEQFKGYAADLELDVETFSTCLDTGKYMDDVTKDYTDGVAYGITGTPAFFLGSEETGYIQISGARPYPEFQFAIEQLLDIMSQ